MNSTGKSIYRFRLVKDASIGNAKLLILNRVLRIVRGTVKKVVS